MSDSGLDPDSPATIAAAIHVNVISAAMLLVQPAFVQALVERAGYAERTAGFVAATEMFGVAAGAAFVALAGARLRWRPASVTALVLMVASTLLSASMLAPAGFGALRFAAGVGSGVLMSISFSSVGATSSPDRNFAWLVTCALLFGAVVVWFMPPLLDSLGLGGVLRLLALYYASGLAVLALLPRGVPGRAAPAPGSGGAAAPSGAATPGPAALHRRLAVAAMFLYYVAQGAVWTYLALMGTAAGLDGPAVAAGLTASQLAGLCAVLVAGAIAGRVTRRRAIGAGVAAAGIALAALLGPQTALTYAALVCLFNAAWNWTDPFLLGTMAKVDATGRVMVWSIAWRLLGLALGPFVAAPLVSEGDYSAVSALGIVALIASFACLWLPMRALERATGVTRS